MNQRLLATDSDKILLYLYRDYFRILGIDVAIAGGGVECVDLIRTFSPHVVILSFELQWGGADGVMSMIREESTTSPIPVILTVNPDNRSKSNSMLKPPIVEILEKPFRFCDLEVIVLAALQTRAQHLLGYTELVVGPIADDGKKLDDDQSFTTSARLNRRPPYFPLAE